MNSTWTSGFTGKPLTKFSVRLNALSVRFHPTQVTATQTFDKLCSQYLEYRNLAHQLVEKTRGRLQCSRLTHAVRTEDRRMNQLLLEESRQSRLTCAITSEGIWDITVYPQRVQW
jgi:hypothetical protein